MNTLSPKLQSRLSEIPELMDVCNKVIADGGGLHGAENKIAEWLNRLGGDLTQIVVNAQAEPVLENQLYIGKKKLLFKRKSMRTIITRFGEPLTYQRRMYQEHANNVFVKQGTTCAPLDQQLSILPTGDMSPGLSYVISCFSEK